MKNSKKNNLLFIIYLICFWDFSHVLQLSNFQLICFFDVYKLNMKRLICFFDILQILIGHLICFFNKFKIADQNFENSLICLVCLIRLICFLVLPLRRNIPKTHLFHLTMDLICRTWVFPRASM